MVRFSPRMAHPKIEELALQAQGVGIFAQRAKFSHLLIRFFFKKHAPFQSDKERVFCYLNLFLVLQAILFLIVPICGCIRLLYPLYQSFLVDIAVSEIHNLKTVSFV